MAGSDLAFGAEKRRKSERRACLSLLPAYSSNFSRGVGGDDDALHGGAEQAGVAHTGELLDVGDRR